MKVEHIYDKGSGRFNEDTYLIIDDERFAVFDGASPLKPYQDTQGRTGAMIAAALARDAFAVERSSLIEAAREANAQIRKAMHGANIDMSQKKHLWATSAAAVKLHGPKAKPDFADWLQIDDSLLSCLE
ncbi:MAG: hypothetical protein HY817_03115 [Candidatus Abawacabacteria bacterium]|nr:hypothetical protein [Candidatus Abawacabacteria bacterium]